MTESEAFEMALLASANALDSFSLYVTFTFAFITAAYLVGSKLTRFQTLVASGLYTVAIFFAYANTLTDIQWWGSAVRHVREMGPEGTAASFDFWFSFAAVLMGIGIFVSLYFMWNVRHPKAE